MLFPLKSCMTEQMIFATSVLTRRNMLRSSLCGRHRHVVPTITNNITTAAFGRLLWSFCSALVVPHGGKWCFEDFLDHCTVLTSCVQHKRWTGLVGHRMYSSRCQLALVGVIVLLCCGLGLLFSMLSSTPVHHGNQLLVTPVSINDSVVALLGSEDKSPAFVQPALISSSHSDASPARSDDNGYPTPTPNATSRCPGPEPTKPQTMAQQSGDALISHAELDHVGGEGATACDKGAAKGLQLRPTTKLIAPIVLIGHNRVKYLARCMMGLLKRWSEDPTNSERFPLFVSIDGGNQRALNFAAAWREVAGVQVISRMQESSKCTDGDCHLTAHFKMLLQLFFQCLQSPRLIFLEEDLQVAPDFLNYFTATAPLLSQDSSLWCISAWNDHGQKGRAVNSTALYRTDILPGLGWMINKEHALPAEPPMHFPEVSRTYHFGRIGTHMSPGFFEASLENVHLNVEDVDWRSLNLTYLLKDKYAATIQGWISGATPYDDHQLGQVQTYCDIKQPIDQGNTSDLVLTYPWDVNNQTGYQQLVRQLPGVMDDIRGERPRASYQGVVVVRCRGRRLFLKPI